MEGMVSWGKGERWPPVAWGWGMGAALGSQPCPPLLAALVPSHYGWGWLGEDLQWRISVIVEIL